MLNVLYIIGGEGNRYGSEIIAMDLLSGGKENGINYTVVVACRGAVSEFCEQNGIPCFCVPFTVFVYKELSNPLLKFAKRTVWKTRAEFLTSRALKEIPKKVDMNSIDVIHTNLSRDLVGGMLAKKYKKPHVWHIQELFKSHYQLTFLRKDQVKWMDEHVTRFIAISDTVAREWNEGGLSKEKIKTILNGIDTNAVARKTEYGKEDLQLVMTGHLVPAKGQQAIIEKIGKLPQEIKEHITVNLIGEGEESYKTRLRDLAYEKGVTIKLLGYCDHVGDILKDFDIGLNCSRGEGFGLTTVEYMAAGLCVLASDTGANVELIRDGEDGVIFKYGDDEDFSRKLISLYNDRDAIRRISEKAIEKAEKCFSIQTMQQNVYALYREVSGKDENQ